MNLKRWLTKRIPQGRLPLYRVYAIGIAFVLPLMSLMDASDFVDIKWARWGLTGYFALLTLISFGSAWLRERADQGFYLGLIGVGAWISALLVINDYSHTTISAMNLVTFTSVFIIESRRWMAAFSLLVFGCLLGAAIITPGVGMVKWGFLGLSSLILFLGNLASWMRTFRSLKIESRLNQARAVQDAAIDSSKDGILLVDQSGRFIKANSSFLKMWNIPQEWVAKGLMREAEARALSRVKDPDYLQQYLNRLDTQYSNSPVSMELVDGTFLESYWQPLYEGEELLGRMWFFHDVTAQKQNEFSLKATQERMQEYNARLMDFATLLANATSLDEAYQQVLKEATKLLEIDRLAIWFFEDEGAKIKLRQQFELLGEKFSTGAVVMRESHPAYFDQLLKHRVLPVANTLEDDLTRPFSEGNYTGKAVSLMHSQIRIEGKCIGVMAFETAEKLKFWTNEDQSFASSLADLIAISISAEQRQQTQQSLENSLALLKTIFDLSETGIIVEDNQHRLLSYNELYLKMWGLTDEFLKTNSYQKVVAHLLSKIKNSSNYEAGLESLKVRPGMEYAGILEFHDGRIMERYSKAITVNGEVQGRVWFYLDITERHLRENELINRNFELDSFVYRASHDLKAPLNSIMGLISLIKQEEEVQAIQNYLQMMDRSVNKLDEFIRQLTQFSQDARLSIVRKRIVMKQFLEDIFYDLKFMENAARLHVTFDIDQTGKFFSDPIRLGIVLTNLISNAIKYQDLKKEQSNLLIQCRVDDEQATIRIADNGVGISEEHLSKVFDLFFRASIQASGSGLGLYITHSAVKKLGGDIKVKSVVGEGTSFVVTVPALPEPDDSEE